jgi:hypothetical protein
MEVCVGDQSLDSIGLRKALRGLSGGGVEGLRFFDELKWFQGMRIFGSPPEGVASERFFRAGA